MIPLLICLFLCSLILTLALCQAAHRGDVRMAGALGIDLAEPAFRVIRKNRKAHRLGRWLAFHRSVRRV